METPLTPLEFARRARRLYGSREAVVDGARRFSYEQFFQRCDRWSAALQTLGVARGDRVAYIATNTTRQLESLDAARGAFDAPEIGERDLLTINYTSGTTSRPKGVMITHRNAYINTVGTLVHIPMTCADRYLWTLPMFHANGWTFTWTVTAAGARHVCLPKIDPRRVFELIRDEGITLLCAAPTVLIGLANAPDDVRQLAPRGVRVIAAGAPPAAATIQRIEGELGWSLTQVYGLTETAPFITVCEPRPEHDALSLEDRAVQKA